ncbi:MAG: Rieske 2Fe-2S domain-containing protein [Actinomycetota bacterium]
MNERGGTGVARLAAAGFGASVAASLGLALVYALGGQPQLEGALLAVALGGIALGLTLWGKRLLPKGPFVEARDTIPREIESRAEVEAAFESGADAMERRGFLLKTLGAALTALGVAALFPIRSLGTRPGRSLFRTHWSSGARVVTADGLAVHGDTLAVGGVLTVFPEGNTDAADSQTLLLRLEPGVYDAAPGREEWSPLGYIAFSKICTHAGCPVGLYQPQTNELFCPCHQSVFEVVRGAVPTQGPATKPLPQLPLGLDDKGFLIATSDFHEPVGPGFWSRPDA